MCSDYYLRGEYYMNETGEIQYIKLLKSGLIGNTYSFEFNSFLGRQAQIVMKYEVLKQIIMPEITLSDFINSVINRYMLQIIEEIIEAKAEIDKTQDDEGWKDALLEELIDICMYAVSMDYLVELNLKSLDEHYDIHKKIGFTHFPSRSFQFKERAYLTLFNATEQVIRTRINFPERKWHKDFEPVSTATTVLNLYNMRSFIADIVVEVIKLCLDLTEGDYVKINSVMNKKQNFIKDLPVHEHLLVHQKDKE